LYKVLREQLKLSYYCAAPIQDMHKDAVVPMVLAKCSKEAYEQVAGEMMKLLADPASWLTDERLEIVRSSETVQRTINQQEPYKVGNLLKETFNSHKVIDLSQVTREDCISWVLNTFKDSFVVNSDILGQSAKDGAK
jgi:hypothetical protein